MDFFENQFAHNPDLKSLIEQYEDALANNQYPMMDQEDIEQIVDYYESTGHYDKALKTINASLDQHPFSGLLLLKKAQLLYDLKICDEASDCLDRAELFEPAEIGIYLLRSEILTFQSQYEESLAILDKAMELAGEEDTSDVWLHMADVYEDWEKYDEVYHCLKECLLADMSNDEALSRINYCMEITDQYEDAITLHHQIIDEVPYSFWAWYNLSYAYASLGLFEKAIDALQYVLAIDEEITYAYKDLAQYYHEVQQYTDALETIEIYKSKTKADPDIYLLEGKCHFELNNLKASRFSFRKVIRISPSSHEAFYNLGMTYIVEEKWKQSLQNLRKASELFPENIDYLERLAEVSLQIEDHEEVKYCCAKAMQLNAGYSRIYITLALSHLFNEEETQAIRTINKGIEACQQDIELRYVRSALLLLTNKRKAAKVEIENLLDESFDDHAVMFKYFPFLHEDDDLLLLIDQFRN